MPQILPGHKANLNTIVAAAKAGHLALMDCADAATGKPVVVLCAVNRESNGDYGFVPLAKLFDGNPYNELQPPSPDGGYLEAA
jgi:hypothetical protein